MKDRSLANTGNNRSLLLQALRQLCCLQDPRLCKPCCSQGVVADSEHSLDQVPCSRKRKDHNHRLKGVTQGHWALEAEPSSELRPWLLVLHFLYGLCHMYCSFPTAWPEISFSEIALAFMCHFASASYCCAKIPGLSLTVGYRRSYITA